MVATAPQPGIEELRPGVKAPVKETLLTPRFYTTDFDAVANLDLSSQQEELEAMLEQMRTDYNRHHFVRDEQFNRTWENVDETTRRAFIDFLERSCTSEFSGFLLFKELSRKLKGRSPLLAEMFHHMARDEARHAGFINKAMADFGISLDLSYLTKKRTYTFFKPELVIYTVYLSEKIGYWRYIITYRHLEKHPEHKFHPLFSFFDNWCQDENRHGDIFTALVRSQRHMWDTWHGKLWARFSLLSVFVTHTLTVQERTDFYNSLGIDATEFDKQVIRETNNTSARAFPVILDVEHPEFFKRVYRCSDRNQKLKEVEQSNAPKFVKFLRKIPLIAGIAGDFLRLYLLKPIDAEALRGTVR
ncbi:MAG: magnesium-protoporphyrin IX monomethyl ester (oxidative) cyclase [Prochloraceae cyanobacterium]|nr:magnesium-protoporphyrin IX monomethyl ester (oxidative) cyclase [Prochloraceae cyanobacterium]